MEYDITMDRVMDSVQEGADEGFCLACGVTNYGIEPDADGLQCDACGELKVMGAEQCLIMGVGGI